MCLCFFYGSPNKHHSIYLRLKVKLILILLLPIVFEQTTNSKYSTLVCNSSRTICAIWMNESWNLLAKVVKMPDGETPTIQQAIFGQM